MEVTYTLEPADMRAFRKYGRPPANQAFLAGLTVWLGAAAVFLWSVTFGTRPIWRGFSGPLTLGLVVSDLAVSVAAVLLASVLWRNTRPEADAVPPAWREPITVAINAGHIYRKDATGEVFTPWRALHSIKDTPERFFVLLHDGNTGFIVPKRAFESPDDAQAFYEAAYGWWNDARTEN